MFHHRLTPRDKVLVKKLTNKIKTYTGVKNINTHDDLIKLQNFVYKLIPMTNRRYLITDKRPYFKSLKRVYKYIKYFSQFNYEGKNLPDFDKQFGGWCDVNAYFMMMLLQKVYHLKQNDVNTYHYGYLDHDLAHTVLIVKFKGVRYLFDPYLSIIYLDPVSQKPLSFDQILRLIKEKSYDQILLTYTCQEGKPRQNGSVHNGNWWWKKELPEEIHQVVFLGANPSYQEAMIEDFGNLDFKNLMARTHGKSHHCYYKFSVQ